ncbi:sel1 repeat family protein [Pseudomonas sivasensis]|uniref:tetratricopeptide repeat protein n=1 Tax=Pseudomonas sivasensis TaxID=1880678 RepID=UPI0021AA5AEB|nr:tetratricopeptide repeat protein [Pseudomonas sivasensis]MCT4497991.1 sel1 repeat family protein [Pseudomonas sivasensis]
MSGQQPSGVSRFLVEEIHKAVANGTVDDLPVHFSVELKNAIAAGSSTASELLKTLADAGLDAARVTLANELISGAHIPQNLDEAYRQLTLAAENGSILAMLILSDWHGNNPRTLHSQPDRARELHWLRQAADLGNETACLVLGDRLVDGRVAESCSQAEIDEIEKYYQGAHYTSEAFYKLARFHSDGKQGTDYTRDAYSKAKMWLRRGKDRHFTGGKSCADLLLKWGLLVEEKEVKVSPASSVGAFVIVIVSLVFWSIVGTGLLAMANAINAVTVPLIIIGCIAVLGFRLFSKRK